MTAELYFCILLLISTLLSSVIVLATGVVFFSLKGLLIFAFFGMTIFVICFYLEQLINARI